jgi:phosphonate transport system ATP-binding protein
MLASSDGASLRQAARQVAMIFQHYNVVCRGLSVQKNVLTGRSAAMPGAVVVAAVPARDIAIAASACAASSWTTRPSCAPTRCRAAEAARGHRPRAAQQPKVILADEPVASLDPKTSRTVLHYLKQASRDSASPSSATCTRSTTRASSASASSACPAGRIVFEGRPDELTDDVLHRIYPAA